jgi:hypothetical protein
VASSDGGGVDRDQRDEGISRVWSMRSITSCRGKVARLDVAQASGALVELPFVELLREKHKMR